MELNPNIIMAGDRSTIYDPNQAQAEQQKLQAGKIELDQAKINDGLQMLQFAKGRPEAWASVRQAAIRRGFPPEIVPEQYDDQFIDQAMQNLMTQKSGIPANIQNAKYYSSLDEAGKQAYVDANRATPYLNTGQTFVKPLATGGMTNAIPITPKASEMPMFEAEVVQAKKTAENKVEKEAAYPTAAARVDNNIKIIDDALAQPGFDKNFGITGMLPSIPGGEAADAQTYIDQIKGTAFLTAIGEMKGTGSISEREGEAATAAVTRLQNAQSPKAARKALTELKEILVGAKGRAATGTKFETNQTPAPKAGSTVKWGDL